MADIEKLDLSMAGERCDDAVLPCPFCGSKNIAYGKYEHTAGRRYAIVCMNCMAQIDPGWAQSWGAVQGMWNRRAQPENAPLTLDELREMDGEPVYVVTLDNPLENQPYWAIAGINSNDSRYQNGVALYNRVQGDWGAFDLYGDTWLAYRRKPERSENE